MYVPLRIRYVLGLVMAARADVGPRAIRAPRSVVGQLHARAKGTVRALPCTSMSRSHVQRLRVALPLSGHTG